MDWAASGRQKLRIARRCYGHLAGSLAVGLLDHFIANGRLQAGNRRCAGKPERKGRGADNHRCLSLTRKGEAILLPTLRTGP